jgi:hypothetical protein
MALSKAAKGVYIDAKELAEAVKLIGNVPDNLLRKGIRRGFALLSREIFTKQKASLKKIKEGKSSVNEKTGNKGGKRKNSTGSLYKSIARKINVNLKLGKAYFLVGPRKNYPNLPSKYAHLVENGARPHQIKVNRGRFSGRTFNHPGHGPQEWLKPSFAGIQEKALRTVVDEIERTFKEVLK